MLPLKAKNKYKYSMNHIYSQKSLCRHLDSHFHLQIVCLSLHLSRIGNCILTYLEIFVILLNQRCLGNWWLHLWWQILFLSQSRSNKTWLNITNMWTIDCCKTSNSSHCRRHLDFLRCWHHHLEIPLVFFVITFNLNLPASVGDTDAMLFNFWVCCLLNWPTTSQSNLTSNMNERKCHSNNPVESLFERIIL